MRDFILRRPTMIIGILSFIFAIFIFLMAFRLSYTRQAAEFTRTAAVGAEKMNLSLEKTQIIVESVSWSKQVRLQDLEGMKWNIGRMHNLYPILHTIYISNREGKVLMASDDKVRPGETIFIGDRTYFRLAQAGHTAITGPLIPRGQKNTGLALIVSSPYYLQNGNYGGVVAAAVNVKTLEGNIANGIRYDDESGDAITALVTPQGGQIFTVNGTLSKNDLHMINTVISESNNQVKQVADYINTFSVAPLSTSTPMWVVVMAKPMVIKSLLAHNLLLALLAGLVMAATFGVVLDWNRRQREQELEKKRQMAFIGEMAATIAHEIRNPLTYIKGKLSLDQEMGNEDNGLMLEEVERIETIVNDILLSAKPIPLMPEKVNLNELINDAVRIMSSQAMEKGITLQLNKDDCDIIIKADRVQLRHVFINLIKNAIEAMMTPGEVYIRVANGYPYAQITVQDTGEGMTEQELQQIGKVFYTTKKGGTGLGITTCHRVVNAHHGKIEVSSTKGVGTSVLVFLPVISIPEV